MTKRGSAPDWGTPKGRVVWLLEHQHGGSRSAMAKATGVSLTGLIKVVTGQQTPGRRLMEKIVQNTAVSPAWLFAGEGQPLKGSAIPVVSTCLPGPPGEQDGLAEADGVPEVADLYAPSRYWLKLGAAEPAVKTAAANLQAGDLMLMETDRDTFPPVEQLTERWGVVRFPGRGGPVLRLAELTYIRESDDNGPAHLEAETFVHHPLRLKRLVVDELANGTFEVSRYTVEVEQPKGEVADKPSRRPSVASILQHQVAHKDVVALCILLVRRFG